MEFLMGWWMRFGASGLFCEEAQVRVVVVHVGISTENVFDQFGGFFADLWFLWGGLMGEGYWVWGNGCGVMGEG